MELKKEIITYFTEQNKTWIADGFLLIGSWEKKLQALRKIFYYFMKYLNFFAVLKIKI